MISNDILATVIENNKKILNEQTGVKLDIANHRESLSKKFSHFDLKKSENQKIHEERIRRIKNIQHQ